MMEMTNLKEQPLLSVQNLTKLYAPGKGFSEVSFELFPGEVLGIVGESGSGKSTLLKAISGRLQPDNGEVLYLRGGAEQQLAQIEDLYAMAESQRRHLLRTEWEWFTSIQWMGCVDESPLAAILASG